jgi:hypothetical protein
MPRHTGTRRRLASRRTCHACCMLLVAVGAAASAWSATQGPTGGGAAVKITQSPPAGGLPSIRARRVVFTCIEPGLTTFADRPCGPWPQVRELQVVGVRTDVSATPTTAASATRPGPAGRDLAAGERHERDEDVDPKAAHAQTCDRLQRALQELDARMRAGYSAREAGRLWSRWREAKERLREASC